MRVSGWWRSLVVETHDRCANIAESARSARCCSTVSTSTRSRSHGHDHDRHRRGSRRGSSASPSSRRTARSTSAPTTRLPSSPRRARATHLPATPIPAVGAATPEEAVRGMIDAAIDLDVARVIELTPPDEMAALHDYGPILVDLAEEALAESDIESELDGVDDLDRCARLRAGRGDRRRQAAAGADRRQRQPMPRDVSSRLRRRKVDETCVDYVDHGHGGPRR